MDGENESRRFLPFPLSSGAAVPTTPSIHFVGLNHGDLGVPFLP